MASAGVAELAWPTLLGSRSHAAGVLQKVPCRRPPALELPAMESYGLRVRNTFIEADVAPPPGLERPPQTCPSQLIGRLLLNEVALDAPDDSPVALPTPSWAEAPCLLGEQLVWRQSPSAGGEPKKLTLQLADAAESRSRSPSPIALWASVAPVAKAPLTPPPTAPAPGSPELPSLGSAGHATGSCKPCAFAHAGRCANGPACGFCHLCGPDERKRRRREKLQARAAREGRREAGRDVEQWKPSPR